MTDQEAGQLSTGSGLVETPSPEMGCRSEETDQLRRFFENLIFALPIRLLVLDQNLRVIYCNPAYYAPRGMTLEQIVGRDIAEVFPASLVEGAGLRDALLSTLRSGERVRWSGYRHASPDHGERIITIRVDPCEGPDGAAAVLLTVEDVTERHRQLYERTILQQISRAMLGQLELPRLLHAILTGMTAGGAVGLGFNRAVLLLVDEEEGVLRAEMAVGPESQEQATAIWSQLADEHRTLDDFLADYEKLPPSDQRPLHELVENFVVPLWDRQKLPVSALVTGETVHVVDSRHHPQVSEQLSSLLGSDEFVVAPIIAKGKWIGAAYADNMITHQAMSQADIQLLTALANQAALSIDSARLYQEAMQRAEELDEAYRKLQQAQQDKIQSEKLAAVGQVTAIVAHEIRNPLSTIGGFARSIARNAESVSRNRRNAEIIFEEVQRLEGLLVDLLSFTRPRPPILVPMDLRPLVIDALELLDEDLRRAKIERELDFDDVPLVVPVDETLFKQVLINLVKNGIEAMPEGGSLTVGVHRHGGGIQLYVRDTGEGIAPEAIGNIFNAFFTTKSTGTGLGLAVTKQIITDHGAKLTVDSQPGQGATFRITFNGKPEDASNAASLSQDADQNISLEGRDE